MEFNKEHKSNIYPIQHYVEQIQNEKVLFCIPNRACGAEMYQTFTTLLFFELYIEYHKFNYVVELGSSKGGLSVYLANTASSTEQFLFHTFEIDKDSWWYNRPIGGVGHWFEKLETISPYIKSFQMDVFGDEAKNIIRTNMVEYKTLIFCDGGNKVNEFNYYSQFLKPGDCIVTHDWNTEISQSDIQDSLDKYNLIIDDNFVKLCDDTVSLLKPFIKII